VSAGADQLVERPIEQLLARFSRAPAERLVHMDDAAVAIADDDEIAQ
jgi:hypothetical protein